MFTEILVFFRNLVDTPIFDVEIFKSKKVMVDWSESSGLMGEVINF